MTRRRWRAGVLVLAAVWLALVFVTPHPVNPPIDPTVGLGARAPVPAAVSSVLRRSCFDCHSDETRWPWYARAIPISWLISHDVDEGRGQLNFSRWTEYNVYDRADLLDSVCEQVQTGEMPIWQYRLLHRDAALSTTEADTVCSWTSTEAERLVKEGME